jgi:two-component system, response regulator PdtaR
MARQQQLIPRILLVDDDPLVRAFACDAMEGAGYEVVEVGNVDQAMHVLENGAFSVVVTDIEMPGSASGIDLAWSIRSRWPAVSVIIMSGCRLPLPRDIPEQAAMLTKPFTGQRLIDLLLAATT